MQTIIRALINLDMLTEDLQDQDCRVSNSVSDGYLKLLQQYLEKSHTLLSQVNDMTEHEFSEIAHASGTCKHITSKRMLGIQIKLIQYVLSYYSASVKIAKLQASEFDSYADKRLDLLQTKAVRARSQFKTVAKAMGKTDLQGFIETLGLPDVDWGWGALG